MTNYEFAFLELYVDVSGKQGADLNSTPNLETYALSQTFTGTVDPSRFTAQDVPMIQNVPVGQTRRVVIDITETVKRWIADPNSNYGLIIGSLTGSRDGDFTIKNGQLEGLAIARVTFFD